MGSSVRENNKFNTITVGFRFRYILVQFESLPHLNQINAVQNDQVECSEWLQDDLVFPPSSVHHQCLYNPLSWSVGI